MSLRDMEKDYTVSTINQANKETPCLQTSSNIVAQTIEVNTTNSISKLQTENINENIINSSSDHPHDSKEIEYVKTIPDTSIRNCATKTKLDDIMLNQVKKGTRLSHEVINLASSLLWEKRNIGDFEDTGLEWNQFSQRRGKDFGLILFIEEKEHWIFVYQKGGSDVNIRDSLRNNGKQDYPKNTVRVICRIACCMNSAIKVNCLQVQQQSNNIDCGVFAIASAVDVCFALPRNESCYDVIEMRNHLPTCLQLQELSPFPMISRRVPRCRLFQRYIDIFCVCRQNFL